ncbi:MAG TPA: hypothetical protein VMV77_16770 [Bacteroidales bacterium]|nr:hypothetical protein [Bacteroidales bacterium]
MPKENKEFDKDFKVVLVEIRYPDGKIDKVAPAAADLLCRKAGCVDVAKEAAEIAAKEAAEKEAAEKEKK